MAKFKNKFDTMTLKEIRDAVKSEVTNHVLQSFCMEFSEKKRSEMGYPYTVAVEYIDPMPEEDLDDETGDIVEDTERIEVIGRLIMHGKNPDVPFMTWVGYDHDMDSFDASQYTVVFAPHTTSPGRLFYQILSDKNK